MRGSFACAAVLAAALGGAGFAQAGLITDSHIVPIPQHIVGSGNGTLDFILLTESAGGSQNSAGGFNGDNANTQMPTGSGNVAADESFITSIGELRDFFRLNFPNGSGGSTVNQLVVMVDVNETGQPQQINLDVFKIVTSFDLFPGVDPRNTPFSVDLTSAQQNATNGLFGGGTVQAELDATPKVLAQNNTGAGFADHAIFTGINPFSPAFSDSDRILLHWESSVHDNGGETIFLSGRFGPQDFVPEPASVSVLGLAGVLVARRARRA